MRLRAAARHLEKYVRKIRVLMPVLVAGLATLVLLAGTTAIITLDFSRDRPALTVGDVATKTMRAHQNATFVSQVLTRALRADAAAQVGNYSDYDSNLLKRLRDRAREVLSAATKLRTANNASKDEQQRQVASLAPELPAAIIKSMTALPDADWLAVSAETLRILDDQSGEQIPEDELASVQIQAIVSINQTLNSSQVAVTASLIREYIQPNLTFNSVATEKARQRARDAVQPITTDIGPGEVIVRAGDTLSEAHIEALKALGLSKRPLRFGYLIGSTLYSGLLLGLFLYYIVLFQPKIIRHPLQLVGVYSTIAIAMFVTKMTLPTAHWAVFAIPLATGSMSISNLLAARLAVAWSVTTALLLAPLYNGNLELVAMSFATAAIGAMGVRRVERIHTFFIAGLYVAAAGLVLVIAFRLFNQDYDLLALTPIVLATLGNGLLAAVLTLGASSLAGILFGASTTMQLLELAHPGQILLRRLAIEAPGTFHHSMLVANIGEQVAEKIGANPLLVRVGAYYHDVGKIKNPYYYIENQMDSENIHDSLSPEKSAIAIIQHSADGLKLARKHRLPRSVQAFIAQHHGDMCMQFFYRKALEQNVHGAVNEGTYRYPGPKPESKETALVMLADSTEAAVRSAAASRSKLPESTLPKKLEEIVDNVVDERTKEGQLDNSALTLQDLQTIKQSFTQQLQGIYHPRLAYPDTTETTKSAVLDKSVERATDG